MFILVQSQGLRNPINPLIFHISLTQRSVIFDKGDILLKQTA